MYAGFFIIFIVKSENQRRETTFWEHRITKMATLSEKIDELKQKLALLGK